MKTAAGGHSVGADTLVNLTAEEKLPSSEEETENDDDNNDGQPRKKHRRVVEEQQDVLEVTKSNEPTGRSERGTPPEESRDRT